MASHHWDFPTTLDLPGHVLHDLRYNNQSHAGLRVLPRRWCRKLNRATAILVRRMLSFLFKTLKTVLTCKNTQSILLLCRDSPYYRGERNVVHKNSLDWIGISNMVAYGTTYGLWVYS
jgi:hypothetical protein